MNNTDGSDMLMGMLQMPCLMPRTATDSPLVFSAATAVAQGYGQQVLAVTNSGTADSHMDAAYMDAAAAHRMGVQDGLPLQVQEAAVAQLKKACKSGKGGGGPKKKPGQKRQQLLCKVDGCGAHLGAAKAYYQRHKVCAVHLSAMSAPVNGVDSRFCQQCGKFQPLDEFDADKRSCRARLKRHNNRRREQRHTKSYEVALELRCQAAHLIAAATTGDEDTGSPYASFYPQQGATALGPGRYTTHYQAQAYDANGYGQADSTSIAAAAAAAIAAGRQLQPGSQQQADLADMGSQWPTADCGSSPNHCKVAAGDGSGIAGGGAGNSEGTTTTTAPVVHSSPGMSPSGAIANAAAAATTAAGVGAGAGAAANGLGTPTSRRPARRVSATRALDVLRCMNASSYSTESDWEDDSEDGTRSPAHHHHSRRQAAGATGSGGRLQGSRLRASDSAGPNRGYSGADAGAAAAAAMTAQLYGLDSQLGQQLLNHTTAVSQNPTGFDEEMACVHPAAAQQQQQQQLWNNNEYDLQGWEASLAAHLRAQQEQQQQWGSAYDGSYGGAVTCSIGGAASYDEQAAHANNPQHSVHVMAAGAPGVSGHTHGGFSLQAQRSAPAGMCFSRSNSPNVSAGTGHGAAAGHSALLAQAAADLATAQQHGQLPHAWSLPAPTHTAGAPGVYAAAGDQQQMHHSLQQHPEQEQPSVQAGSGFEPMQAQDFEQVLQQLMPVSTDPQGPLAPMVGSGDAAAVAAAAAARTANMTCAPSVGYGSLPEATAAGEVDISHSPPEVKIGGFDPADVYSSMAEGSGKPTSHLLGGKQPLSSQSSMTAAAAAYAAAFAGAHTAAAPGWQTARTIHLSLPGGPNDNMPGNALTRHHSLGMLQQQQQGFAVDSAAQAALMAAAAAVMSGVPEQSPGSSQAAAEALMGQQGPYEHDNHAACPAPVSAGAENSQGGSSALRDEMAGVSLDPSCSWHMQGVDAHMASAAGAQTASSQQQQLLQDSIQQHMLDPAEQHNSPTAATAAAGLQLEDMVQAGCQMMQQASGQESPPADFDSAATAAAAATFEAQLAACCGNKESQEAVFRAWLDALLPQGTAQHKQPQQQQVEQVPEDLAAQPGSAGAGSPSNSPADGHAAPQQHSPNGQASPEALMHADQEFADDDDIDIDAAAAALHLAAQRVCLEAAEEGDAGDAGLNPEEDFKELLDLLLDA